MNTRFLVMIAVLSFAPIAAAQDARLEEELTAPSDPSPQEDIAPEPDLAPQQVAIRAETPSEPTPVAEEESEEDRVFAAQAAERQRLRPWHIVFGNLTWAASNLSTIFGYIQFSDRFGFTGNQADAACTMGGSSPIFGEYCAPGTVPVPHAVAVTSLTIFYGAAFSIAAVMPDPFDVGSGNNDLATRITIHRALRWASLGILVVQIILGAISANVDFGDFGAERAMAATHLALGTISYGVITAQGIVGSLLAY